MNTLLNHFSRIATYNDLHISEQQILKDCIIGLDISRRKILVTSRLDQSFGSFVIDIKKVRTCTVRKYFGNINAGGLKKHKLNHYLDTIVLHFEMKNRPAVEIVFFHHLDNAATEASGQEKKAQHWETVISEIQKAELPVH